MPLSLGVLGGVKVETEEGPLHGRAAHRRRLALLALLAAAPRGLVEREKLIGYLWPDSPPDAARHLLSESLYVLRRELKDVFLTPGSQVGLDTDAVSCDLVEFREATAAQDWERAASLYAGPFLDGFYVEDAPEFERWVEVERETIGREYARALTALAESAEAAGDAEAAAEWWGRLAVHDRFSSRVALRLMQALAKAGERARAVQFAAAFVARLREEGFEPGGEVLTLAERLRAEPGAAGERLHSPVATSVLPQPGEASAGLTPEFDVLRQLGEGSVARVYLAREPALGRLVALKVMAERYAGDEVARARFEREARAAARIQHPHVATVFRIGRTPGGLPFIVLPYVDGGSLEDRLAAAGRFSGEEVRRYVGQTAAGLAAAHRLGIVHRDVRPANLLYDRETDRVLLSDFGLAAVLETGAEQVQRLTRPGERLGNPAYASPEQLRGEPVTERADVYSLGVVAFELLTGRLPFDAATPLEMTAAHLRREPPRAAEVCEGVDPELDDLTARCLNKRPEQRPFAVDIADALGWV
ncbi:MAG TPA: protein kinase [Longimicrobiaceae bacterium]|nr:protein kinase [Longimicrobiaceae bacterium]